MQLRLQSPLRDKGWILFAENLLRDEKFRWPGGPDDFKGFPEYEDYEASERRQFDMCVQAVERSGSVRLGLFNQCIWPSYEEGKGGISGWEYWCDDHPSIRQHAASVAAALGLTIDLSEIDQWIATGRKRWS